KLVARNEDRDRDVDYVSLSRPARHNTGMPVYQLHQSSAPSADTTCPQSPHTVILWEYGWRWADALRAGRPGQQFVIRQGGPSFYVVPNRQAKIAEAFS